jgi:hypothetical protein
MIPAMLTQIIRAVIGGNSSRAACRRGYCQLRRQFGVSDRMLNVSMPQILLDKGSGQIGPNPTLVSPAANSHVAIYL